MNRVLWYISLTSLALQQFSRGFVYYYLDVRKGLCTLRLIYGTQTSGIQNTFMLDVYKHTL